MKLEFDLREDEWDHDVPLAPATVEALRAARAPTGGGPLVFPSAWDAHGAMSGNAIGYLYNRIGHKSAHVPHDCRSALSTVINGLVDRTHPGADRLLVDRLIIDFRLVHVLIGIRETEFRYNRNRYMERRRELAAAWADMLMQGAVPAMRLLEGRRRSAPR